MTAPDAVVVGGGLAGLAAAAVLSETGFRVCLFEKRERLGGRATSYQLPGGNTVDNCQHVTLGCCTNLDDFYRRVGASGKIRWYRRLSFLDSGGRRGVLGASPLVPPFHLAFSFLRFPLLTWAERRAIGLLLLKIARWGGRLPEVGETNMLDWLRCHGQPAGAIERFWRVVLVSALNEQLERASARYGVEVFWKAFLANRRGFQLGIPAVPLADLYGGCRQVLEQYGGVVRAGVAVREIVPAGGRVAAVELDDGSRVKARFFVSAVPHNRLLRILPQEVALRDPALAGVQHLKTSPITSVHLWLDRPVMDEPFAALVGCTVQWIFNKSELCSPPPEPPLPAGQAGAGEDHREGEPDRARGAARGQQYLQLVISAAHDLVARPRQEIIDLCRAELSRIFPLFRQAQLLRSAVIKETAATFSPEPGCDRWRPGQRTCLQNLFLAGDWTQTGWPATMEGAVRSGYLAAEALLAADGRPQRVLQPDLPLQGWVRRWSRHARTGAAALSGPND